MVKELKLTFNQIKNDFGDMWIVYDLGREGENLKKQNWLKLCVFIAYN